MPLKRAILIGLVINELICNSVKHARENAYKGLKVWLNMENKSKYLYLNVQDNGLPANVDSKKDSSMGMLIIHSHIKNLKGDINLEYNKGLCVHLKIPTNG